MDELDRWEEMQRKAYRQAILRQIIREEIKRKERIDLNNFDEIDMMMSMAKQKEKESDSDPFSKKFVTYVRGERMEGPRKKKNTKSKLKRKICSCKKN